MVDDDESYVTRHERFVSGHNGTSVWEVQLVTSIGPLALLLRNLAVPWLFPTRDFANGSTLHQIYKLLLDYIITVVPILLSITIFAERSAFLAAVLSLSCVVLVVFSIYEHIVLHRDPPQWSSLGDTIVATCFDRRPVFLSYFRAHIFIATILGILAVDFQAFPRRFAKAETFGYGLMDVGVGLFVIANGLVVDSRTKFDRRALVKNLKHSIPLVILGFVRLWSVKMAGYQEHVTEYGVHWNFFFTLAAIKILSSLLSFCIRLRSTSIGLGLFFTLGYEYALQHLGLKGVILYGTGPADTRDNLFDANREGILSISGYLALYFFGVQLGDYLMKPRRQLKDFGRLLVVLINLSFLSCVLLLTCDVYVDPPSRRMANLTYVLWMIFLTVSQLTLFVAVQTLVLFGTAIKLPIFSPGSEQPNPFKLFEPCLWKSINSNALTSFLLANVMTGFVNLNIRTMDVDNTQCVTILLIYSFSICTLVYVRYVRGTLKREGSQDLKAE